MLTCKEFAEREGYQRLIGLARGESYRVTRNGQDVDLYPDLDLIFESLKLLMAYGIGKPAQLLNVTHNVESLADWVAVHFASQKNLAGTPAEKKLIDIDTK